MTAAQEMLLQMAKDNTRLALDQLDVNQIALAMTSLKTAQMNLEHFRGAGAREVARPTGKQLSNSQPTTQPVIEV